MASITTLNDLLRNTWHGVDDCALALLPLVGGEPGREPARHGVVSRRIDGDGGPVLVELFVHYRHREWTLSHDEATVYRALLRHTLEASSSRLSLDCTPEQLVSCLGWPDSVRHRAVIEGTLSRLFDVSVGRMSTSLAASERAGAAQWRVHPVLAGLVIGGHHEADGHGYRITWSPLVQRALCHPAVTEWLQDDGVHPQDLARWLLVVE